MDLRYTVSFPHPASHVAHVRIDAKDIPADFLELVMPSWMPGSYKIRDFARNVQGFRVEGHQWKKQAKNRWRVFHAAARSVVVEYDVFCFELSVQTSHVDDTHAFLSPGTILMYLEGFKDIPCTVRLETPRGWKIATGMDPVRGRKNTFRAADYDILVDSPIEAGEFRELKFRVRGVPHRFVIHGGGNLDEKAMIGDVRKICETEVRMMRDIPYRHYTFILHTAYQRGGGGLEHLNSTALQTQPFAFRPREKYENFLELVAHEFFHLWNVKRLRPEPLGPFDYEKEVYTTALWAMEGITSYYDGVFPTRAKIVSPEKYFKKMGEKILRFEDKPGRKLQSLAESSFDTWIKLYQPNENSLNSMMSYYEKGELVGFLLDMEIRRATKNRKSLDDVMRTLYREYGRKEVGYPEGAFRKTVERLAGRSFGRFWRDYIEGTAEIDWNKFLSVSGMHLVREPKKKPEGGVRGVRTWLGVVTQKRDNRMFVLQTVSGGPAWRDGLSARDELVAIDGHRVDPETWEKRIAERRPGDTVEFSVFRDNSLRTIPVKLGKREDVTLKIKPLKKAKALQKKAFESWLGNPWKP